MFNRGFNSDNNFDQSRNSPNNEAFHRPTFPHWSINPQNASPYVANPSYSQPPPPFHLVPPPNVPTPSAWPTTHENGKNRSENQREADQDWVNEWLKKVTKTDQVHGKSASNITIPNVKANVKKGLSLLLELRDLHGKLAESMSDLDKDEWKSLCQRAVQLKGQLHEIQCKLYSSEKEVRSKLRRIKSKRNRIRRQKEEYKKNEKECAMQREHLHELLDNWQSRLRAEEKQKQKERELKKEADGILSEVRKKQMESRKTIDLIKSLRLLRHLRKQADEKRVVKLGTGESERVFSEKMTFTEKILHKQMIDYEGEERALRVMLDQEAEQKEERDLNVKLALAEKSTMQWLFGENDVPDELDPIYPYWLYYTQAERDFNALLQIRREWDSFALSDSSVGGSSIPVPWVSPESPNSDEWAKTVLENENQ